MTEVAKTGVKIVLLGKTGNGKSSIGNKMLGEHAFEEGSTIKSKTGHDGTSVVQATAGRWLGCGTPVTVIDTGGLYDSDGQGAEFAWKICEFLGTFAEGVTCVVVVIKASEEKADQTIADALYYLNQMLGPDAWKHTRFVTSQWNKISPSHKATTLQKWEDSGSAGWQQWLSNAVQKLGGHTDGCNFQPVHFDYDNPRSLEGIFDFCSAKSSNYIPKATAELKTALEAGVPMQQAVEQLGVYKQMLQKMEEANSQMTSQIVTMEARLERMKAEGSASAQQINGLERLIDGLKNQPRKEIHIHHRSGCCVQ